MYVIQTCTMLKMPDSMREDIDTQGCLRITSCKYAKLCAHASQECLIATKAPAVRNSTSEQEPSLAKAAMPPPPRPAAPPSTDKPEGSAPQTTQKKQRRRLPTTPERDAAAKRPRRSGRLSNENEPDKTSPHKAAHAKSHANHERSPSPFNARPVTVEKKRRKAAKHRRTQ